MIPEVVAGVCEQCGKRWAIKTNGAGKWECRRCASGITDPIRRATPRVGRNEPCTCGSGEKFKRCCAKKA